MCMNIGNRIKQKRKALGFNQTELASHAEGVTRSGIASWENTDKQPSSQYIVPLAKALQVSVEWLLTGADAMPLQTTMEGAIDESVFLECYELFEDAVILSETAYSLEVKSQCLVKMYCAAVVGNSPARAMLQYLTSLSLRQ